MNNYEKIKNMTPNDLAYFIWKQDNKCACCSEIYNLTREELKNENCDLRTCSFYIKQWLESETK